MEFNEAFNDLERLARIAREKRQNFQSLLHAAIDQHNPKVQLRLAATERLEPDWIDAKLLNSIPLN